MGKVIKQNGNGSKGGQLVPKASTPLGQRLREISDRALASGVKTLTRDQIQQAVRDARGSY